MACSVILKGPTPVAGSVRARPGCDYLKGVGAMRVLVVEDHPKLATALGTILRREGMAVDIIYDRP